MTVYNTKRIIKESFWLLTICILIEILAGQLLNSQEKLIEIPVLLASIPVINGIGGNLGSILGAKLTSGLHIGTVKPSFSDKKLVGNISDIIVLAVIVFIILIGCMIILLPLTGISFTISLIEFVLVVFVAGLIMTLIIVIIGVGSAFIAFKRGIDPDNVVTPIVTTSGDMIGISIIVVLALFIVI